MTTIDEGQTNTSAETDAADAESKSWDPEPGEVPADDAPSDEPAEESPHHTLREKLLDLERRAVELPIVGRFHTPDKHDFVYYTGIAALITFGIVEWPIALAVVGGHLLVKQHHSRTLSAIGEVMEDFWR